MIRACVLLLMVIGATCLGADLSAWQKKMSVTCSGYVRDEPLTNFPALVVLGTNLAGFSYSQFQTPDGEDLRFTDATGANELNYEVEHWNTSGSSCVWVQIPQLTNNCTIYAFWGMNVRAPPCATNGATWDSHFVGVWHMHSTTNDSTARRNHGNHVGAVSPSASGQANGAVALTNTLDAVLVPYSSSLHLTSNGTIEAWAKFRLFQDSQGWEGFIHKGGNPDWSDEDISLQLRYVSHYPEFLLTGVCDLQDANTVMETNRWYYLTGSWNVPQNYARLFVNAALRASGACAAPCPDKGGPFCIGSQLWTGNYGLNGWMDEVRISDIARPTNWIWATWMTMASNSVFTTYQVIKRDSPVIIVR